MIDFTILYNWLLVPLTIITLVLFLLTWKKVGWNGFFILAIGSLFYTILRIYVATIIIPGQLGGPSPFEIIFILLAEVTRLTAAWYFYYTSDKFFLTDDEPRDTSHDVQDAQDRKDVKEQDAQDKKDVKEAEKDAKETEKEAEREKA
jgi:hypothetical protein